MANAKLDRAFDVMVVALGEAGQDRETIVKFVQHARQFFGVTQEESSKTRTKAEIAVLAEELKEKELDDDSSLDGGSKALKPRKAS